MKYYFFINTVNTFYLKNFTIIEEIKSFISIYLKFQKSSIFPGQRVNEI